MSVEIRFKRPFPVLIVKKGSPAWRALRRICNYNSVKEGAVFPVSNAEFNSLKKDVLAIEVEKK